MKKLITILTILIPVLLTGQETKEIIVKFPNSKQIKERYSVLNSDTTLKNGEYLRYFKSSKPDQGKAFLHSKGYYTNGEKNGEWENYDNPSDGKQGNLIKKEFYNSGAKTGIWETHIYDKDDHIIKKYDYSNNKELDPKILINLRYPPKAVELGIQGNVVVKFRISDDCKFEEIKIIKSLYPDCDNEVIRRFNRISELNLKYGKKNCEEQEIKTTIEFNLMK